MGLWQSENESNRQGFMGLWASSAELNPVFKIPLITSPASIPSGLVSTFTRNSTATYIDANGVLQTAAINVPRFQNGRYLVEPAATNMLLYSELLTNVYWSTTGLAITEDIAKSSFKLTNTTTGSCYTKSGNISYTSGTYYTQSAVLEKGNTDFASMTFPSPVNSLSAYAVFNLNTGVVVKAENCTAKITSYITGTFRCSITMAATATVPSLAGLITPCREDSLRATGVIGDYIYATKIQVEIGQQLTSYIPTTSAPLGRVADVLNYDVSSVITQGQGSLYCEFWDGSSGGSDARRILNLSDNSLNNRIYTYISPINGITLIGVTGGVSQSYMPGYYISTELNKVLFTYKENQIILYVNGVKRSEDLSCEMPTNFTTFSIGCSHDGTLQLNSEIGNVKYFKEVLTPAEAIKITTV